MKKLLAITTAILALGGLLFFSNSAKALVAPNWNASGNYVIGMDYLGTDYNHDLTLSQDGSGNLTGNGGYPAGGAHTYAWSLTSGSVSGNSIDFLANYTAGADALSPLTTLHVVGTIGSDGKISGTWSDNYQGGSRSGDLSTVSGAAVRLTRTITASAGANGSISPSGSVLVNSGANQTFTITPNSGFYIDNVIVDSTSAGAVSSYTFTNVTANHTISASFAVNTVPGGGPSDKNDCKNGGWKNFSNPTFKNQGQCVSAVAKAKVATSDTDVIAEIPDFVSTCSQSGQLCNTTYSTPVNTNGGDILVRYTVRDTHCSSVRLNLYLDGNLKTTTPYLGWNGATGEFATLPLNTGWVNLGSASSGAHTVGLKAEGQTGGCNTGTLASWGGELEIMES